MHSTSDRHPESGAGSDIRCKTRSPSWATAASAVPWPPRCGTAVRTAAGTPARAPTSSCSASPTRRSPLPRRPIAPGPLVGHCSGATGLDVLAPHEAFALHPLMTVTRAGADFAGAGCAIGGSTPRALDLARRLAAALGMRAFEIADEDRTAYHAAASMAANFLVTLESAAARVAATAGVERELLVPLVRAAVERWAIEGDASLTGPIARGDEATVARHREAIAERAPELLELYDVLAEGDARRWRHEDGAHRRRGARGAARRAPGRARHRPRPDDGRAARRPSEPHPPRARHVRRGRRLALRQPGPVQRVQRPGGLPARRGPRRRAWRPRRAPTCSSRRDWPRSTRRASRPRCTSAASRRRSRASTAASATSRASRRWSPSC